MRVSAIHDRRFPAVNSCTKCNSRAEDAIHRGCKKRVFTAPILLVLHGKLWDCNIVKKFNTGQVSIADAMITDKETKSGRGGHRPPAIRAEQWLDL